MRIQQELDHVPGHEVANHRIDSWWWLVVSVIAIVVALANLQQIGKAHV